jgi:predicted ATPase
MQLKKLYIKEYKILKDFTIEFPNDLNKYISVFIGANGSGKSTILEAIAEIISCAILLKKSKFDFELEYSIKSDDIIKKFSLTDFQNENIPIKITGDTGYLPKVEIDFNSLTKNVLNYPETSFKLNLAQRDFKNLMPDGIIIYYSGLSEIMEELCKPHDDILSKTYRKGNTDIKRDFFYYKPVHFGIILLSLLSFEYGYIPNFLRTKAKIEGMRSVQIRLKKPPWHKDSIDKFWGAEGNVRKFLDYLNENSATVDDLNNLRNSKRKGNIVLKALHDDALIITINGLERLYEIREHLIEERNLFEVLNIMLTDGLLDDISFSLLKIENGNYKNFNILSEGEQQAITIKGLTELLSGKNTLFLFDEPDTYLHPSWQRQFINEIENNIKQSFESENSYLIATHSPQLLSNAHAELNFVKIIENGSLVEKTPQFYGREISSILYNLMGVEERNETIKKDLNNLFTLIEEEDITESEKELFRLTEILGETDSDIKNAEIQIQYLKEDEANNKK